ncbi:hypothetical protein Y032_0053g2297 [Ancylostoma ceylanicum]|uniref:Uncharacterized protein n=1 Tax=Ancylostoma ceylanicum TaxID=53326 RepID=A0A016U7G0_9BILA|nr:hypothetical protein Y032_0053g2297 [Ancylostoma ceylanicum]
MRNLNLIGSTSGDLRFFLQQRPSAKPRRTTVHRWCGAVQQPGGLIRHRGEDSSASGRAACVLSSRKTHRH